MSAIIDSLLDSAARFVVIDLETTMNGPDSSPDPFHPDNKCVMAGRRTIGRGTPGAGVYGDMNSTIINNDIKDLISWLDAGEPQYLIGHNIKFDLHYLRKHGLRMSRVRGVFDTMVMCHNLSDTEMKFPTLDKAAEFCGLPDRKDDTVKKLWEAGVKTEDINPIILEKYLRQDIELTAKVFKALWERVNLNTVIAHNKLMARSTEAIEELEWNGMFVDTHECLERQEALERQIGVLEASLTLQATRLFGVAPHSQNTINPTSNTTVSTIVYGHPGVTVESIEPNGTYKNGKPKTKKVQTKLYTRHTFATPVDMEAVGKVDEDTLQRLLKTGAHPTDVCTYVSTLLAYRKLKKSLSTYYKPFTTTMLERNETYIRPQVHQVATSTGRTASSKPNGQNIPSDVREVLTSRYPGGSIMSADFNQLEVCGIAQLSQDTTLIKELSTGGDIHTQANGGVRGTPEERRDVKGVVFGTFYGGGVPKLAAQTGLPEIRVRAIQTALKKLYPEAMKFNANVKSMLDATATNTLELLDNMAVKRGTYLLPTGRSLSFRTKPSSAPIRTARTGYGPAISMQWPHTQCCDRPIQALSTGDLSQAYLGLVHHFMKWFDSEGWFKDVKLIMFAHDELVFDVPPDAHRPELIATLTVLAESVLPELYIRWTGTDWLVPLKLNVSFNKHWSK